MEKRGQNGLFPSKCATLNWSDGIESRERKPVAFGRGPNMVKYRLISIGWHSYREWQDRGGGGSISLSFSQPPSNGKKKSRIENARSVVYLVALLTASIIRWLPVTSSLRCQQLNHLIICALIDLYTVALATLMSLSQLSVFYC